MAKKLVAVCLVFVVVLAALNICEAATYDDDSDQYKECFNNCLKECENDNANGRTFCEMTCDSECANKEAAEKLKNIKV